MFGFAKQSKADRSMNWREPASGGAAPQKWGKPSPYHKAPTFKTKAFAKKPVLVNPFPPSEFWHDFTEFSTIPKKVEELDKCELCKCVISRACFPQRLNCCEHVFCAACINKYYVTEKKKQCPFCEEYICFEEDPEYCRECCCAPCRCAEFEREEERERALEQMSDGDDEYCRYCGGACFCDDERACPCGFPDCGGGCGALACGCTDFCKGKCDPEEYCGGF
jgi:hypothetical protein